MYTYKLGGMLITDELYHDDLEAMTFGRKDQNELMHYGIKGQSWGKRRFQNEDGSLTMAGRNRYDVGDPLQGSTNRAVAANRTYATGGGTGRFGGASGGGGSVMRKSAPTIQWSTPGKAPFSSEGPGQSAGRTVTNKVKAKVNDTVNSGRKAADSLFGSIGNAIKPVTDAVGKATEFVTGANANRRVADAQKAYDDASRHMLVDNMSNVIGTKGTNAEHDAENWQQLADIERARAKAYDISANNRGLFDFGGKEADRHNRDMYENEAREYANKANDLRVQAQKEYADDYRKLEEADRNLRAAEKARDENTLGGVVGNAAKDAGNWLGNAFNDAKNWVGDRAQDVGKAATNAYNDVSKAAGDAANWVGDRAKDVGNLVSNQDERQKMQDIVDKHYDPETNTFDSRENFEKFDNARTAYLNHPVTAVSEVGNWVGDRAKDIGNAASNIWDDVSATARGVADSVGNRLTGNIDRNTAEYLRRTADFQEDPNAPFHAMGEQYTPENLRRQADEYQQRADNSLFSRIGNAAKDVGDWASNAASDVRDWGAGAVDKGRQAFENLFGRSEAANNTIPEQRIEEQRIPEQRIEEQRIPEQKTYELGDTGLSSIARQYMNQQNSQNNRPSSNNFSMSDKPDGVSDEYWQNYTSNGGTRESYDRQMQARQNSSNDSQREQIRKETLSDKPDNVSDDFWEEYKSNGGTREGFDRTFKQGLKEGLYKEDEYFDSKPLTGESLFGRIDYDAIQKRMNDTLSSQNGNFASTNIVSGNNTVDNSRPYHFAYDPASGQTIVVYDDEKRR